MVSRLREPLGEDLGGRLSGRLLVVPRASMGWQTMLADLSLILFMVAASAMADAPTKPQPKAAPSQAANLALGEPVAIWRDGVGAPDLAVWLAGQQRDARQQLTITLRYRPADQAAALARGGELATMAVGAKFPARVILEPVAQGGLAVSAALAYDLAP